MRAVWSSRPDLLLVPSAHGRCYRKCLPLAVLAAAKWPHLHGSQPRPTTPWRRTGFLQGSVASQDPRCHWLRGFRPRLVVQLRRRRPTGHRRSRFRCYGAHLPRAMWPHPVQVRRGLQWAGRHFRHPQRHSSLRQFRPHPQQGLQWKATEKGSHQRGATFVVSGGLPVPRCRHLPLTQRNNGNQCAERRSPWPVSRGPLRTSPRRAAAPKGQSLMERCPCLR
mmetsp:Transcript_37432/g.82104  ORF Transcript_37432/g.82104 Transcript_37432/m.82104 type:complete len:222 (-) Transcript_37432:499-1164(-)